jgi:uncharacterized membrane protein
MNLAHVHLLLNHFPVIGVVFGFLFLAYAVTKESEELKKTSLGFFVLIAILALPVYFTGEPAEEVVKDLPGVTESVIEEHEEAALIALIAVEVLGVIALGGLFFFRGSTSLPSWFIKASLVLSLISVGLMAWTANLGGQVRHVEIRSDFKSSTAVDKVTVDAEKGSESNKQKSKED